MEKGKRRPNFTADEVEVLLAGVEKRSKVRHGRSKERRQRGHR